MTTTSPKFSLNVLDGLKSLAVAALSQPILVVLTSFSAGHFIINWTEQWHLAVSAGAAYLIKNFFSGVQPPTSGNPPGGSTSLSSTAKMAILFLVGSGFALAACGQSIFKPLPLAARPLTPSAFRKSVILPTDSLPSVQTGKFQGFRFAGPDLSFAIPDFSIYTGLGIDWVSATADPTTGKWAYNFTIGPRVYGGANLGVPTVRAIGAVGFRATFFDGWLAVGVLYNLTTKKPQATIGNPAALIPGLN